MNPGTTQTGIIKIKVYISCSRNPTFGDFAKKDVMFIVTKFS